MDKLKFKYLCSPVKLTILMVVEHLNISGKHNKRNGTDSGTVRFRHSKIQVSVEERFNQDVCLCAHQMKWFTAQSLLL